MLTPFAFLWGKCHIGMANETNILAHIPGDLISDAMQTLPDCAAAPDEPREITIDVAGRFTATITFRRFHEKR